jgi:spore germination cell wall hydrolase CwlJ-like protein
MVNPQTLDEIDVLTRTVYGEAREESQDGQVAVAWVIRNRVAKGRAYLGKTIKDVCLKSYQFSCWNYDDPNQDLPLNFKKTSAEYQIILEVVKQVLDGTCIDNTQGSTHYHNKNVSPSWANSKIPVVTIGNYVFYNNIV